ncbi:ABC transporter substrate-binding protein [Acidipropionibacterium virtanenii]|nr:extracellular solute-binding protein [Acidipropionibacterium virtanenii]
MPLAAAPPLLAGCGTGAENRAGATLVFWSWVPGIDKAVALWNRTHPQIQVDLQDTPAGSNGTYAKMYAAIRGGRGGPDVAQVEYQELPGLVLENGMADLGPLGMRRIASRFVDWQLAQCTFEGHVYAVPQASGPMGLFYRRDIFSTLHLDPPTTWQEFADAAEAIHRSDPKRYICTFPPGNSAWFAALAWQAGARWFGVDGSTWKVTIDTPTTIKVAEYWDDLRKRGVIATMPDFSNSWYADLQNGNIATWPSAQWGQSMLAGNAPKTSGKWSLSSLPQWDASDTPRSANWGGSATGVFANSPHQAEAAQFAMWLNTAPESIDILIAGGAGWPAVKGGSKGTALDEADPFLNGQNAGRDVFIEADANIDTKWQWGPTTANTYAHLNDAFAAAVAGNGSFAGAVRKAQEETVRDLRAKGLTVEG